MFARAEFGRYYCGDYYAPEFTGQGFVPWFDHRMGAKTPDPLFAYARWQSRKDPQWEQNLRGLHKDRPAGTAPRPPITLVHQREVIHNVTINKTVKIGTKTVTVPNPQTVISHMTMIAPLTRVDHKEFRVLPIPKANQAEEHKAVQHLHAAALERQQKETKVISQGLHPIRPTDASTRIKVEYPKIAVPAKIVHVQPPPPPVIPKHVSHPAPPHQIIPPLHVKPPPHKGKSSVQLGKESPLFATVSTKMYGLIDTEELSADSKTWEAGDFFLSYARFYGLTEPTEKTLVGNLVGKERKEPAYPRYRFHHRDRHAAVEPQLRADRSGVTECCCA